MTSQDTLPFAPSCENNKDPILKVLKRYLTDVAPGGRLLEIGGGTAQHACYFASQFPNLIWQSSEQPENLATLNRRIDCANLANLPGGQSLNVDDISWHTPPRAFHSLERNQVIFTANTLHIMGMDSVNNFFAGLRHHLLPGGLLILYGPFKYAGEFTSPSNASFDQWLKTRDPLSGIRDFEAIVALANRQNLILLDDHSMPANNQMLIWERSSAAPQA